MRERRHLQSTGVATLRKPGLVVAGEDRLGASFQLPLHGWDVVNVPAPEAVHAAIVRKPAAMVLPNHTGIESGFLVAAKLRVARPKLKVVLVGPERTSQAERLASFVGARFVAESEGVPDLLAALAG